MLLSYPIIVEYKSKIFSAYIINELIRISGEAYNSFNGIGVFSFEFINIRTNSNDAAFLNDRIGLMAEEDNLIIYNNLNLFEEKHKAFPHSLKYSISHNQYTDKMQNIRDPLLGGYSLLLYKYDLIMISYPDGSIKVYNEELKYRFENELIEYFAFVNYFKINEINDVIMEDLNDSQYEFSNFSKPSIKPYQRESINFQPVCDIDFGDKRATKRDLRNRKEYIMNVISTANERFRNQVEEEIVNCNFKEKHRKVSFCIPNNIETIINQVKK